MGHAPMSRRFPRRGLGTAADSAVISKSLSTAAPYTAAIPVVGPIIAGILEIASAFHIGEGCGAACTDATNTETPFELAGWNVELAGLAGMITQEQALAALEWLMQQGTSALQQLQQTDPHAGNSIVNLTNAMNAQIAGVRDSSYQWNASANFSNLQGPGATLSNPIPVSAPTAALDPQALQSSIFVQPGAKGWPTGVPSSAQNLALQAIAYATNITETATSANGSVTILGSTYSTTQILVALGILAVGIYLVGS
jgi:hypothetical protein